MKLHREGRLYAWISIVVLAITTLIVLIYGGWLATLLWVASVILTAFVFYFFRHPSRPLVEDPAVINCPADGTIVAIEKVFEPEYFQDERWQISIFMSPLNVHLNRIPTTGKVTYYTYHKGKYLVAWHPKSSTENERNTIVIQSHDGQQILLRQIAGAVARRIVCNLTPGMQVRQGDELGFIKFGSRVDVFLPLDVEILVEPDQKVKGNIDVLARWNKN